MKRFALLLALLVLLTVLTGCGEPKTVSCDHCGATIELTKDSNITDESSARPARKSCSVTILW